MTNVSMACAREKVPPPWSFLGRQLEGRKGGNKHVFFCNVINLLFWFYWFVLVLWVILV